MGLTDIQAIKLHVFELVGNDGIAAIGEVEDYTSLQWTKNYYAYGQFSLKAIYSEVNVDLLKAGNLLSLSGELAIMMITVVKYTSDDKGKVIIDCSGRGMEFWLANRITWGRETYSNKYVSTIIYSMFSNAFIDASKAVRNIPLFDMAEDKQLGGKTSMQKTGQSLYDTIQELAQSVELGFRVNLDYKRQKLVFEVYQGADKSMSGSLLPEEQVVFSDMADEFLQSEYYLNTQDERNICLVYGEGEYPNRKQLIYGDDTLEGFARKELWVDAKDLQSENEDGETSMTDEEYYALLRNRGAEKLAENARNETFEAKIKMFNDKVYQLDKDFFLGDKVTILSKLYNVKVDARITGVTYNISSNLDTELTFGYGYPTIAQSVRKMISNERQL